MTYIITELSLKRTAETFVKDSAVFCAIKKRSPLLELRLSSLNLILKE